jgi:hypothetical protein
MAGQTLEERLQKAQAARKAKRLSRDVDVALDQDLSAKLETIDAKIGELEQEIGALEREKERLGPDLRLGEAKRPKEIDDRIEEIEKRIEELIAERAEAADGTLATFRFEQVDGQIWSEITTRNPPRPGVNIDSKYGYNWTESAKQAATVNGVLVHKATAEDGTETEELEPVTPAQWGIIWELLSGHDFGEIVDVVWTMNEFGPERTVDLAGKASRAGSGSKSS